MNVRIKEIRKSLKLSQAEFGQKIKISGPAVAKIESGKNSPSDQTISLICSTFNVNYIWLKDGIGEMFLTPTDEEELVDQVMAGENEFAKNVMIAFAKLDDNEWLLLKAIVDKIKSAGP